MEPRLARSEPAQQLAELRAQLAADSPQIYRHWALYLQVLRQDLPAVVDKLFFHLAVEVHPERYRAMDTKTRHELHGRLGRLVLRASSLLTVEQLNALAVQTNRRLQRRAQRQQRRWLTSLQQAPPPLFETGERASTERIVEPPGSVSLGMAMPISTNLFATPLAEAAEEPDDEAPDQLQHIFAQLLEAQAGATAQREQALLQDGLLPTTPKLLLHWFDACEAALQRRLRNLSHAINVELVRLGLSSALLPLPMLEAVAAGQLESQDAPLHFVRINLPMEQLDAPIPTTVLCVLLRPADLEADTLRLRTCRSRLQQSRQQVRRMAQTYQRLERRLLALEAEQLWLLDHSTAHPTSSPAKA